MFTSEATVERIRKEYPAGCRIVLDRMDDSHAPPIGLQGTVHFVDDIGSICPSWDNGGSLNVVYGEDLCHKICTDEEAKVTIDWYGKKQPEKDARCPRCGERMEGRTTTHAWSRWADIMVCDMCGGIEAMEQAGIVPKRPLMEWVCITEPGSGKGAWGGK